MMFIPATLSAASSDGDIQCRDDNNKVNGVRLPEKSRSTAHTHASASLAFAKYLRALVDFRFLARPATAEPPTTFTMVKISLPGPSNPARNVLTGYLGSCYSQPEKGPWLYLHCTSSTLRRECANIREIFNRILTQSARRPTPVRISIRTPASIPNAPTDLDAL
jgi:hypothetical protein